MDKDFETWEHELGTEYHCAECAKIMRGESLDA